MMVQVIKLESDAGRQCLNTRKTNIVSLLMENQRDRA